MIDVTLHLPLIKEKLQDIFINSGETGRFEKEVFLERSWIEIIKNKCLEVEARFKNNGKQIKVFNRVKYKSY